MSDDAGVHGTRWTGHRGLDRLRAIEFGVATSGFQSEGGLDGDAEPQTHWSPWQRAGRIERIGAGAGLWTRFPEAARRARLLGVSWLRMGVEWARLCPTGPSLDPAAVEAYADRIVTVRAHGPDVLVTLLHFTHPAWLGADLWLSSDAPRVFTDYALRAVEALNRALVRRGSAPLRRLLTLNEPNMLALASYVAGVFPHGAGSVGDGDPRGFTRAITALDAMLAAHVSAWRGLHALYAREGWGAPDVSTNVNLLDLHTVSKGLFDLLRAPSLGVPVSGLAAHMASLRARYHRDLFDGDRDPRRARFARVLDGALARLAPPARFDRTLAALYEQPHARTAPLDHLAVDVYDPFSAQQLVHGEALVDALAGAPSLRALWSTRWRALRLAEPWEWRCQPETLVRALRALAWPAPTLPIDVDENGMALRRDVGGVAVPRADGVTRPAFLRGYVGALVEACVREELPVRSYVHWTLVDNYELGRWAPRFGLYGLDDAHDAQHAGPWRTTDAAGDDAAETYAALIAAVREAAETGDGAALDRALAGP